MAQKQQTPQAPKHLLIDLEQSEQMDIEVLKKQICTNPNVPPTQKYQINSLNSLKSKMNKASQKNNHKSVQHMRCIPTNIKSQQENYQMNEQIILEQYDISSNPQSTESMNGSVVRFIERRNKKVFEQFDFNTQNQQSRQDSPQKLKNPQIKLRRSFFTSLLAPSSSIKSSCYKFLDEIYDKLNGENGLTQNQSIQTIHDFVHNALPQMQGSYMRYVFQIHSYKYTFTFHSCYEFYLRNSNGEMIHLLKSQKDSMTVSSSHMISAVNPLIPSKKQFTAKLKYNTAKSEYNLYNVDERQKPNQPRKFLATIFYQKPLGDERLLQLYVPKSQSSQVYFLKSEKNKNLNSFYNESESPLYRNIQKLSTSPIPKDQNQNVRNQFSLKKQGRPILLLDQEKAYRFYMGKRQDQRYIILAAGALTPLQIFALAIANLDH